MTDKEERLGNFAASFLHRTDGLMTNIGKDIAILLQKTCMHLILVDYVLLIILSFYM